MSQPPEQPYPAQGATLQQPSLPEEEIPTQRTPRVVMPIRKSSTEEKPGPPAADPAIAEIDEAPTQRIRRIKTPTPDSPTQEKPGPPAADPATAETDEAPTQRIRRIKTPTPDSPTQEKPGPPAADPSTAETDEAPTQRIRRIKTPTPDSPTQEKPDPAAAESAAVDTEKVDPAPDDPEDADTVEMPSVLAVVSGVRDPAADTEKTDGQKQELVAAHTGKIDAAAAGPDDADSLEKPPVLQVVGAGGEPFPRSEHQVAGPVPTRNPAGKKRLVSAGLAALVLSALLVGALYVSSRDAGNLTAQSVTTGTATASATAIKPTSGASTGSTDTERHESSIQVKGLATSARPFQTVRIQGKYRGRADTYLRVQRWDEGAWLAFPLPTKTDQSGKFTAYVELEHPGRYPLRVLDPDSGTTSKTFVLLIES